VKAQSLACVPLEVQDRVVGVLALFNKSEGHFTEHDIDRLQAFANPVATAIQNARLYARLEQEQATVHATVNTLPQPFLILDDAGETMISNKAANALVETNLAQLIGGVSDSAGRTAELAIGDKTYLTTSQHAPQVGTIVVMQDITYVKNLEQARAEFVHALSHDLKSPLAAIRAWAQMLQSLAPLTEETAGFVTRIVEATDRMLHLIGQLLDIALLSEAPDIYKSPCNLADTVQEVVKDLGGIALTKTVKLGFKQVGTPYLIWGDNTRLYRTALNLVDNALKYSPENTSVDVTLTFGTTEITLQVRDEGPGIPEADQSRIFEKYYRGEQAHGEHPGIGLGLVMVQATAKAHGGKVSVRNLEGRGAEFTLTLPATLRVG
jgi:signal transduction histidine kinase